MNRESLWRAVAYLVTRPRVRQWLIDRAAETPYTPITGPDGSLYMWRGWLFNPYPKAADGDPAPARWPWLPSIRIHHIQRPDSDRHLHSHPWIAARTIILQGSYLEQLPSDRCGRRFRRRCEGDTGVLQHEDFHRIDHVSEGGVWTLFVTWQKAGTWYFDVDGKKVQWREYLGVGK